MIPAASVVRGDFAMLLISPYGIERELVALLRAGFKIVGQTWTALREEAGRIAMLHLPGLVERTRTSRSAATDGGEVDSWIDLTEERCGATQHRALVDAVILVDRVRRPVARLTPVERNVAVAALRSAWPITDLHPHRRHGEMAAKLAQQCSVFEIQLSSRTDDLLAMIKQMRHPARSIEVTLNPQFRRKVPA